MSTPTDRIFLAAVEAADAWLEGKPPAGRLPPFDPATWPRVLGSVLHDRRLQLGLSALDLAAMTGVSEDCVRHLEGKPPRTDDLTRRLAVAMGLDVLELAARHYVCRIPPEVMPRARTLLATAALPRETVRTGWPAPRSARGAARARVAEFLRTLDAA